MPAEYEITDAQRGEEWTHKKHRKTYIGWTLRLKDAAGIEHTATTNRAPTTPEPVIGDTIYGDLDGDKFTRQQRPDGPRPLGATAAAGYPPNPTTPAAREIYRRDPEEQAFRAFEVAKAIGVPIDGFAHIHDFLDEGLAPVADWFIDRATKPPSPQDAAALSAEKGGGGLETPAPSTSQETIADSILAGIKHLALKDEDVRMKLTAVGAEDTADIEKAVRALSLEQAKEIKDWLVGIHRTTEAA